MHMLATKDDAVQLICSARSKAQDLSLLQVIFQGGKTLSEECSSKEVFHRESQLEHRHVLGFQPGTADSVDSVSRVNVC